MSEERDGRSDGAAADPADAGARGARGYERLARDAERRVLAGVCTGLGRYTGIDPVVFRVGFAVLVLARGQGVFLYVAAALLMPASPGESSLAEQLFKRRFDASAVLTILGALLGAGVAFSLVGGAPADAVAVLVVFGLALLVAHSRGVDLVAAARSAPDRLSGHPPEPSAGRTRSETVTVGGVSLHKEPQNRYVPPWDEPSRADRPHTGGGLPEGMIDLAVYSAAHSAARDAKPSGDAGSPAAPATAPGGTAVKEEPCCSPAATITLLAAMAAAGAVIPVARAYPAPGSWLIVMAAALAVVGLGLVVGGWFRTRGLATAGTVLTLAMLTTSVAGEMPRNAEYGEVEWRPVDTALAGQEYKVGVGQGTLDLTALPVGAGQRVTIDARVMLGGLEVRVPPAARVMVDARIMLGDLRVGSKTTAGPNVRSNEVMEPEGGPGDNPPVIVLRIRGTIGDVDVNRA